MMPVPGRRGVLLLAHGARDPRWALPFEAVEERLRRASGELSVTLCFLEFMSPGIVEAGDRQAAIGCEEVHLVPLFLGAGGHVRKDVPALLAELQRAHPQVRWRLHSAVGESELVIDALAAAAMARLDEPASAAAARGHPPDLPAEGP